MKQAKKPFYVGYLNMPTALKKFFVPIIITLNLFAVFAGYTIANQQKSTDPGIWQTATQTRYTGILKMEPYPVLHIKSPNPEENIQSVLLVNQGKYSADIDAQPFVDQLVSVTGYEIKRGGWVMLELGSKDAIQASTDDPATYDQLAKSVITKSLGAIKLSGEIADSKCFLGVMKPGAGAVHKACAEVCLRGGIPAMLLVRADDDKKYGYMLTQSDGSSYSKSLSHLAAEHVQISGNLEQKGNLLYIRVAENGVIED